MSRRPRWGSLNLAGLDFSLPLPKRKKLLSDLLDRAVHGKSKSKSPAESKSDTQVLSTYFILKQNYKILYTSEVVDSNNQPKYQQVKLDVGRFDPTSNFDVLVYAAEVQDHGNLLIGSTKLTLSAKSRIKNRLKLDDESFGTLLLQNFEINWTEFGRQQYGLGQLQKPRMTIESKIQRLNSFDFSMPNSEKPETKDQTPNNENFYSVIMPESNNFSRRNSESRIKNFCFSDPNSQLNSKPIRQEIESVYIPTSLIKKAGKITVKKLPATQIPKRQNFNSERYSQEQIQNLHSTVEKELEFQRQRFLSLKILKESRSPPSSTKQIDSANYRSIHNLKKISPVNP